MNNTSQVLSYPNTIDQMAIQMFALDAAIIQEQQNKHILLQVNGTWQCDCEVYDLCEDSSQCHDCEHTLALKRYLKTVSHC